MVNLLNLAGGKIKAMDATGQKLGPIGFAASMLQFLKASNDQPAGPVDTGGPTDAEVLASDLRLRRRLAMQRGSGSTMVSGGGLAGTSARMTLPTLVGVA